MPHVDSLLVSGSDHSPCQHDPRRRSQHRGHVRLFPSAHIYPVGSVAVLINLETTPVQLHTTPPTYGVLCGRKLRRLCAPRYHLKARSSAGPIGDRRHALSSGHFWASSSCPASVSVRLTAHRMSRMGMAQFSRMLPGCRPAMPEVATSAPAIRWHTAITKISQRSSPGHPHD